MSYILEALKKSEQERERGNVPDIKSVHSSEQESTFDKKRSWWPYLLLLVLLVNIAIFAVIYIGQEEAADPAEQVASKTVEDTPGNQVQSNTNIKKESKPAISQPVKPEAGNAPEKPPVVAEEKTQPRVIFSKEPLDMSSELELPQEKVSSESQFGSQSGGSELPREPVHAQLISELPDSIRQNIPNIEFAGHVYSSSKARRSVMINGRKMREGEAVSADLFLHAITPEGAEFDYRGYRFKLNALQDWSNR